MNDLYYNPYTELYHHGIKGQKWGIRRYQNSDGSLTDEGRRRYGFGSGKRLISKNTTSRMKQGMKLGAKIGAGVGAGMTASILATAAAGGMAINPPAALAMGATFMATYAASGAGLGLRYGTIAGVIETRLGRDYIKSNDKGLKDFEMRELKAKKSKR